MLVFAKGCDNDTKILRLFVKWKGMELHARIKDGDTGKISSSVKCCLHFWKGMVNLLGRFIQLSEGSNEGSPHGKAESSELALKLSSFRDHCSVTV